MCLYQHLYIHFFPEQLTEFSSNQAESVAMHQPLPISSATTHAYHV